MMIHKLRNEIFRFQSLLGFIDNQMIVFIHLDKKFRLLLLIKNRKWENGFTTTNLVLTRLIGDQMLHEPLEVSVFELQTSKISSSD